MAKKTVGELYEHLRSTGTGLTKLTLIKGNCADSEPAEKAVELLARHGWHGTADKAKEFLGIKPNVPEVAVNLGAEMKAADAAAKALKAEGVHSTVDLIASKATPAGSTTVTTGPTGSDGVTTTVNPSPAGKAADAAAKK